MRSWIAKILATFGSGLLLVQAAPARATPSYLLLQNFQTVAQGTNTVAFKGTVTNLTGHAFSTLTYLEIVDNGNPAYVDISSLGNGSSLSFSKVVTEPPPAATVTSLTFDVIYGQPGAKVQPNHFVSPCFVSLTRLL